MRDLSARTFFQSAGMILLVFPGATYFNPQFLGHQLISEVRSISATIPAAGQSPRRSLPRGP